MSRRPPRVLLDATSQQKVPKELSEPERKVWIEEHYAALEVDDAALEKKREQPGLTVAREAVN
jgi:hypothetical protein